jgi:hypothetical protein
MELADIQRRAAAAREFEHPVGERSFRLRIPTQHEVQVEVLRAGGGDLGKEHVALALMQRAVLERAIIGWQGVTTADLLPGEQLEYETADFASMLVPLLLDAMPDVARELTEALIAMAAERNAKIEAARKN